jgi:signal transduction histidine kinase
MSTLVDDLLFLARADSDALILDKTTFSLDQAMQETVSPFESVAKMKILILNSTLNKYLFLSVTKTKLNSLLLFFLIMHLNILLTAGLFA